MDVYDITNNAQQLCLKMCDFLIRPCRVKLDITVYRPITLYNTEGQLIYNSGNRAKILLFADGEYVAELATADTLFENSIRFSKSTKKPDHGMKVWLNGTANCSNWRLFATHTHVRGFIVHSDYTEMFEDLVRYTDALLKMTTKMMQDIVNAKFANKINNYLEPSMQADDIY